MLLAVSSGAPVLAEPSPGSVEPPPASAEPSAPARSGVPVEPAMVEACDGSRRSAPPEVHALACHRWTIAWQQGGAPWGLVTADSYDRVVAERERQLGFARQYARFFEVPFDERYADPSPPICDTCERDGPGGRWGDGQKFGDAAARQAVAAAELELAALDAALREHAPRLTDAARLSRDAGVGKAARAYAKALRAGMQLLAKSRLAVDDAALLRSERAAKDTGRAAKAQVEALASTLAALRKAVGKEVARAHAGRYLEEGAAGPERPHLQVEIDGVTVKATYFVGAAQSTWFEGEVELDGGLTGRSLVAPEQGATSCAQHSEACGFVYIPSVLRFTERTAADGKTAQTAELWFQRSAWVMAKPFSRPAR